MACVWEEEGCVGMGEGGMCMCGGEELIAICGVNSRHTYMSEQQ